MPPVLWPSEDKGDNKGLLFSIYFTLYVIVISHLDIWGINILPLFHFQWHGSSRLDRNGHLRPCTMLLSRGSTKVNCWRVPRLLLVSPRDSNRPTKYEGHLEWGSSLCFSLILLIKFWFITWDLSMTTVRKVIYVVEGRAVAVLTKALLISKGRSCTLQLGGKWFWSNQCQWGSVLGNPGKTVIQGESFHLKQKSSQCFFQCQQPFPRLAELSALSTRKKAWCCGAGLPRAVLTPHLFLLHSLTPQWEPIRRASHEWPWALASAPNGAAANPPGIHTPSQERACTTSLMPATLTALGTLR